MPSRRTLDPDAARLMVRELHLAKAAAAGILDVAGTVTLPGEPEPSHSFILLRPRDLVFLDVSCYGCSLVPPGEGAETHAIVPDGEGAWLRVLLPFQHLGEQAWYRPRPTDETEPPKPVPGDAAKQPSQVKVNPAEPLQGPPIQVRAAEGSRLAFDVPVGERIEYTIPGVLEALSRLPLRVSRLATPRPDPGPSRDLGLLSEIGSLLFARTPRGLVVARAPGSRRVGPRRLRGSRVPDVRDVLGTTADLKALRGVLNSEIVMDPEGVATAVEDSLFSSDVIVGPGQKVVAARLKPRPPDIDVTAIEAPYRLIISPSDRGGFAHAPEPVQAPDDPSRVELWHTRLGVRVKRPDGTWAVDERAGHQRAVRAIWARDLETKGDPYAGTDSMTDETDLNDPFRMSLDPRDRGILVRQTADERVPKATPEPVSVDRLYLSALGAWLDLHGLWDTHPYTQRDHPSILSWDHIAPMGRDQDVRVVYPGYLFPFGHPCALVKLTERKILRPDEYTAREKESPQARLFQRKFLVVGEPIQTYEHLTPKQQRELPFREVRISPEVTPDIDDPLRTATKFTGKEAASIATGLGLSQPANDHLFFPVVGGSRFEFTLDCRDHSGEWTRYRAPLLFVAAHLGKSQEKTLIRTFYESFDTVVGGHGQSLAFARPKVGGDTSLEVRDLRFSGLPGDPGELTSTPRLVDAGVIVPALHHLAPEAPPVRIRYEKSYLGAGLDDASSNAGEVFAELLEGSKTSIVYGDTSKSGGLISPNFAIEGLSRKLGPVGDVASIVNGSFGPTAFTKNLGEDLLPKLFGIVKLTDLLAVAGLDGAPRMVTEILDAPQALLGDLARLRDTLTSTVDRLGQEAASVNLAEEAKKAAQQLQAQLAPIATEITGAVGSALTTVDELLKPDGAGSVDDIRVHLESIGSRILTLEGSLQHPALPPTLRAEIERLTAALKPLLATTEAVDKALNLLRLVAQGMGSGEHAIRARYEWKPQLKSWGPVNVPPDGFTLALEARTSPNGDARVDLLAELRNLRLDLLPGFELMELRFDRIAYRATTGRKPEIDVRFAGIKWKGVLEFVETLSRIIPFDALSDPPYVDVTPEGAKAGMDIGVPNLAVGVFSLENVNVGVDCQVPFLGESLTVGFAFCSKERPFRLSVALFGGGGFLEMRAAPKGLVLVAGSLEFGARVAMNFGVASGSIEAMGGIFFLLEGEKTTLEGFFRIRGEVRVLLIAYVCLTAELALRYRSKGDGRSELVGRATVTLTVEVAFISKSVSVQIERRFAGANGDPIFAELLDVQSDGSSQPWVDYCLAFAED